jgi:nucleoside-diphosphate-sugar epimerase
MKKQEEGVDRVLITGATGFIGSHIIRRFCAEGIDTVCLVRKTSNLSNIAGLPVETRYGDIEDLKSLVSAFRERDFVIHTAAFVSDWGDYDKFYEINVKGTLNVLRSCCKNRIKNVIITGSISSYGEEDSKRVKDENSPCFSHYHYFLDRIFPCKLNYYRDTKAIATRDAVEYAAAAELNLTVIEPVWVYGERELGTGFFEYLKTAGSKVPLFPGSKHNKFHTVYAEDLARAYFLAFKKRLSGINRIIVGNQKAESMDDICSAFCREANVKKPLNAPKWLVYPFALVMELLYTALSLKTAPLLTRGRVNMFYDNIEYSIEKARKLLGFTNNFDLKEGVGKTVQWYQKQQLL